MSKSLYEETKERHSVAMDALGEIVLAINDTIVQLNNYIAQGIKIKKASDSEFLKLAMITSQHNLLIGSHYILFFTSEKILKRMKQLYDTSDKKSVNKLDKKTLQDDLKNAR